MNYINIALFLQMFIWFNLYKYKELPRIVESVFYISGTIVLLLVYLTGFSINFFTTWILGQYISMVLISTAIYSTKYPFNKAVSLSFLTVFLNSFWWEIFYHIYEVQIWYPVSLTWGWLQNRLVQYIRIVPFFWLRRNFELKGTWIVQPVLILNYIMARMILVNHLHNKFLHPIHRLTCLISIIYVVMISKEYK